MNKKDLLKLKKGEIIQINGEDYYLSGEPEEVYLIEMSTNATMDQYDLLFLWKVTTSNHIYRNAAYALKIYEHRDEVVLSKIEYIDEKQIDPKKINRKKQ